LAAFFWTQSLAVTVSKLLAEVVLSLGVDGVYLDGYANAYVRGQITQDLFAEFLKKNNSDECFIDVNGDGKADSVDTAVAQVDAWGRYFVLLLRQVLGPSGYVLRSFFFFFVCFFKLALGLFWPTPGERTAIRS
jgi:hypothetical protein